MIRVMIIGMLFFAHNSFASEQHLIWQIGQDDQSGEEFALYPDGFEDFIASDFGWEDKYYLVGTSNQ